MRKLFNIFAVLAMLTGMCGYINQPIWAAEQQAEEASEEEAEESEEGEETEEGEEGEEAEEAEEAEEDIKNYDVKFDEMYEESIYPSFVLYSMMDKSLRDEPVVHIKVEEKAHVKVTIEENALMEKAIFEHDMTDEDEQIYSMPLKWKRSGLLDADQPGFINFTAVIEVDGQVKNRFNKTIDYRSVNEAVLGIEDADGYTDLSPLFACYVNETNPEVDETLGEILEDNKGESFFGYQGSSEEDVLKQLRLIWNYFSAKGTHYSSISGTTNNSQKIFTQHVRFFSEVVNNNQANCIDGTCMLASLLKKIELDVSIVLVPGHAFLAVGGQEKNEDGDPVTTYFIETTMMGSGATLEQAIEEGTKTFEKNSEEHEAETFLVNISKCRSVGIMPIGK